MFGKTSYFFIAFTAALWAGPATGALWAADIEPEIEYEYYDVTPEEGRSLSLSLTSASPIFHNGSNYAGLTKSYFSYQYGAKQVLVDVCRVRNVEVKCRCVITLPRLTRGGQELARAFNDFLLRLRAHELEHCRISAYYASRFNKYMANMGNMKCSELGGKVRAEYDRLSEELRREQINYDRRTVHGKYEGADLNQHLNKMERDGIAPKPPPLVSGGGLKNIDSNPASSGIYRDKDGVWRNY